MTKKMNKNAWLKRAEQAYLQSTTYIDNNYRKQWNDNIRYFYSRHHSGSKYLNAAYKYRSKIFRPKTRTAIRNSEAAAMMAFFGNKDVVDVEPQRPQDKKQAASAAIMKKLLEYRLQKTIPWFMICIGGLQNASVTGVVASYNYWEYQERKEKKLYNVLDENGEPVYDEDGNAVLEEKEETIILKDRPVIELIPIENLRIHSGASWIDPINTSPYIIHLVPMYVIDVKAKMNKKNPKTGQPLWHKLSDGQIQSVKKNTYDSTRQTREDKREDVADIKHTKELQDYDIVWVHHNFMRVGDEDYVFYTLGTQFMLTDPQPIREVYFHGERPFTMGYLTFETHKIYPSSKVDLGKNIQKEINEIANQRLDNIKLVMNKRWFVTRGKQVDLTSLTRNVAGGVTLVSSQDDVQSEEFHDVTGSSYMEQDRLNVDYDELIGNFSASTIQTNRRLNETVGGMQMLRGSATSIIEYDLRVFAETWVEPTLRQLAKLEQYYETDEVILAIAADKANLFQRFGIDKVTDDLLNQELTLSVNLTSGATDPLLRVQNFILATRTIIDILAKSPPGLWNIEEVIKEVFGRIGYKNGMNFFQFDGGDRNPEKMQLVQALQKMQGIIQALQAELQSKAKEHEVKLLLEGMKQEGQDRRKAAEVGGKLAAKHLDLLNPVPGETINRNA